MIGIDVERSLLCNDVEPLQGILTDLACTRITQTDLCNVPLSQACKLIQLLQMSVQYLHWTQDYLNNAIHVKATIAEEACSHGLALKASLDDKSRRIYDLETELEAAAAAVNKLKLKVRRLRSAAPPNAPPAAPVVAYAPLPTAQPLPSATFVAEATAPIRAAVEDLVEARAATERAATATQLDALRAQLSSLQSALSRSEAEQKRLATDAAVASAHRAANAAVFGQMHTFDTLASGAARGWRVDAPWGAEAAARAAADAETSRALVAKSAALAARENDLNARESKLIEVLTARIEAATAPPAPPPLNPFSDRRDGASDSGRRRRSRRRSRRRYDSRGSTSATSDAENVPPPAVIQPPPSAGTSGACEACRYDR